MKKSLLPTLVASLLLNSLYISVFGQPTEEWASRYNGPDNKSDLARKMAMDAQGNIYVTGQTAGKKNGTYYTTTIKYNAGGVQQWVASYSGPANGMDLPYGLAVDASGNVYVTSASEGSGTSLDIATIKYNSSGGMVWVARYDGALHKNDVPGDIKVDADGNVFVTGFVDGNAQNGPGLAIVLLKYDAAKSKLLDIKYDHLPNDNAVENGEEGGSLAIDPSGNILVTGRSGSMVTLKFNPSGVLLWSRDNNLANRGKKVLTDASGNVYVCGSGSDYLTLKLNTDGDLLWQSVYDGPAHKADGIYDMALSNSGDVYITGFSQNASNDDYETVKYNGTDGSQAWESRYNGSGNDRDMARGIALDGQGNAYVTGTVTIKSGRNLVTNFGTIRYNGSTGEQEWEELYSPKYAGSEGFDILVDANDNVVVTGESAQKTTYDYATVKYSQGSIAHAMNPGNTTAFLEGNSLAMKNYPNPFSQNTTIEYNIKKAGWVRLEVYDLSGKKISSLVDGKQMEGRHTVKFEPGNLPSNTYVYRIQTGDLSETRKLILIK